LGFDLVIPLSWGDELVAEAALRALEARGPSPALLCSCPLVRQRLLQSGADLANVMVSLVSPSVAVARHLRASIGAQLGSLSFVGRCPDALPPEYDATYEPAEFFSLLKNRGIELEKQSEYFMDRLPADRRRFVSLPGGCPSAESLWQRCNERTLVEVEGEDFPIEIAQHLMSPQSVLVDSAAALRCHCSGVTQSTAGFSARIAVTSLEPPRSSTPIVVDAVDYDLEVPIEHSNSLSDISFSGSVASHARTPMAVTPPSALPVRPTHEVRD
jgi:hypothetical protein